jgi:hypothetical protein
MSRVGGIEEAAMAITASARPVFGRRELFFHGWIEAYQPPRISCLVRDLTPEGTRILVRHGLPARFRLCVEAKGLKADCEIVDKGEGFVDVRFV